MITKAVILAAGRGTRFYPVSGHTSKEVVLLDAKPMIAHLLEEVATAGIKEVCLVTSLRKADLNWAFEFHAKRLGLGFFTLYQQKPQGTARALWLAKDWIEEEPFFLYYADDLWLPDLKSGPLVAATRAWQLFSAYLRLKENWSVLSLMRVSPLEVDRFGIVSWDHGDGTGIFAIRSIREKPKPEEAPSDLALVSGMILRPNIFEVIMEVLRGHSGSSEIFLTEALNLLASREPLYGCLLAGEWIDVGTLEDYPRAFIRMVRWRMSQEKRKSR